MNCLLALGHIAELGAKHDHPVFSNITATRTLLIQFVCNRLTQMHAGVFSAKDIVNLYEAQSMLMWRDEELVPSQDSSFIGTSASAHAPAVAIDTAPGPVPNPHLHPHPLSQLQSLSPARPSATWGDGGFNSNRE